MSSDPILDRFSDLTYPGRRAPVNRTGPPSDPKPGWDEKPLKYSFNGVEREFFTISHLAAALDRSVVTIRAWENRGVFPRTPYRSPRPRGGSLPNNAPRGKRLWTRDQISGILRIASEEKVILNGKPPTQRFAQRVLELYKTLLNKDSA